MSKLKSSELSVRPLTLACLQDWFTFGIPPEEIDSRRKDLSDYLQANPDLAPETYLIAQRGEEIIGKMSGVLEPEGYIATRIRIAEGNDPQYVASLFLSQVRKWGRLRALSWEGAEDLDWRDLLEKLGFEAVQEKPYFRRNIEGFVSPYEDPFFYRSLKQLGESEFLKIFSGTYEANLNRNFNLASPETDFRSYLDSAGILFDPDGWVAAFLQDQPAGIILPQRYPDTPRDGTMMSLGLTPEFRKRGYGKILHAKGLEILSKQGATGYVGSTDVENIPMIRVFLRNGCAQTRVRRVHQEKL